MGMSNQNYPDLSKPLNQGSADSAYPDLSKPMQQQNPEHHDDILKSMWDKYQNFMQPKTTDSQGAPMVETPLGRMPHINSQSFEKMSPQKGDFERSAGLATMFMAPELKVASLLPASVRKMLPEVTGGLKILRDTLGATGKTAAGAYLGTKIMPGTTDKQANNAAAYGGGTTLLMAPLMMALASQNPFVRYMAGGGLGAAAGYGVSHFTGHPAAATGIGGLLGSLAGGRGRGAAEMAAHNAHEAMVPANAQNAQQRIPAANAEGIPLSMPEATGSPVHQQMYDQAASSAAGSKVIYPWALNRENAEKTTYNNLLNKISPDKAKENIINPGYKASEPEIIPQQDFMQLLKEPTIKAAFDEVANNPYYARELQGFPINSIKYMDTVKKHLGGIVRQTRKNESQEHLSDLQNLDVKAMTATMDKVSAKYAEARQAASNLKNRQFVEKKMAETNLSGSDFYSRVLQNDIEYKKFYEKLADPSNPKVPSAAQQSLANLKTALPDLMNNISAKSGKAMAKQSPDNKYGVIELAKSMMNKLYMNRYNKAVAELMTNPNWQAELAKVAKMKAGEDRGIALGRLISQISVAGSAENKQGSEGNGGRLR